MAKKVTANARSAAAPGRNRGRPRPGAVPSVRRMLRRLFAHVLPGRRLSDRRHAVRLGEIGGSRSPADAAAPLLGNQRKDVTWFAKFDLHGRVKRPAHPRLAERPGSRSSPSNAARSDGGHRAGHMAHRGLSQHRRGMIAPQWSADGVRRMTREIDAPTLDITMRCRSCWR
jgi:hypothetical protein